MKALLMGFNGSSVAIAVSGWQLADAADPVGTPPYCDAARMPRSSQRNLRNGPRSSKESASNSSCLGGPRVIGSVTCNRSGHRWTGGQDEPHSEPLRASQVHW